MTLRVITVPSKNKTTIRVEGRLTAEGVEELQKEIQLVAGPVHLDLADLQSADAESVRALLPTLVNCCMTHRLEARMIAKT